MTPNKLPPLPEPTGWMCTDNYRAKIEFTNLQHVADEWLQDKRLIVHALNTADQMHAYAEKAIAWSGYVHASDFGVSEDNPDNTAALQAAVDFAARQSQSLPAGAVAGLAAQLRQMACWCKSSEDDDGTGTFIPAYASGDVFDILTQAALQADAREKGDSASLNQIPKPCKYPPVDSETGADTGSCCHHAYADGWNECRAEVIRLATQPAQASEKGNG